MSKVKIQGHASGSGTLTLGAPNTDSDRTITLPDETATLSTFDPDGAVTINDTGADVDFRVEGSGAANALFVQGSDGNVGIGTNSPTVVDAAATGLHIHGDSNATNRAQLHLTSATTGASGTDGMYILYDGVTPQIQIREDQPLVFWLNGSERMRVLSSGGLTFNGDTAAANALDDYEEGSWTPVVRDLANNRATLDVATGSYTKIGRWVQANFRVRLTAVGSVTGNYILIGDLPFNHPTDSYNGTGIIDYWSGFGTNYSRLAIDTSSTGSVGWITGVAAAGASGVLYPPTSVLSGNEEMKGSMMYQTSV